MSPVSSFKCWGSKRKSDSNNNSGSTNNNNNVFHARWHIQPLRTNLCVVWLTFLRWLCDHTRFITSLFWLFCSEQLKKHSVYMCLQNVLFAFVCWFIYLFNYFCCAFVNQIIKKKIISKRYVLFTIHTFIYKYNCNKYFNPFIQILNEHFPSNNTKFVCVCVFSLIQITLKMFWFHDNDSISRIAINYYTV